MAASPAKALIIIAAVACIMEMAAATNYTVGSPGGSWNLTTNFTAWASTISFKTGDNLVFSYNPASHDVLEVSKANYDSCSITRPIKTYNSGNDVIPLSSPGERYFICGFPAHCGFGMKLRISTTASTPTTSPPPSGNPPTAPPTSSPPGSPPSTTSPPPSGTPPQSGNSPLPPSGSPPPEGAVTPPTAAGMRSLEGKAAAAGLISLGMLISLVL